MELHELKQELIKYGKLAGDKNMTPGISGNISARFEDKILITTSGSANGYLEEDELVLIDYDGNLVQGEKKPSSEKMLHVEYYKQRPDINYILHMHSPYLSTFAACNKALDEPLMPENIFYFGQIPLAEYGLPGSWDLVEKTSKYFKDYNVILMANHGMISAGTTAKDAYMNLELAESYAQVVLQSHILGGAKPLNEKEVQEILSLKN
ncbi:class II aldolase/adducin family protein [bacterium]|nr:class II aldolase/adducin family protein [bacterium]